MITLVSNPKQHLPKHMQHSVYQKRSNITNNCTYPTNYFPVSRIFFKTIFSRLNGISEIEKEVDFLLWTKDNPTEPDKLKVGDVFSLHLSHFKSDLPTKILIHGFEDTGTTGWVLNVRDEYFKKESCNVISVDWRKLSNTYPFYNIAAANTKSVGYLTASLVNFLGKVHAIQFNKITDSEYTKKNSLGNYFFFYLSRFFCI